MSHYVQLKGKFQPVNVIPSGQIKCSICNRLFPKDSVEQHFNTHIQPKFLVPQTSANHLKKMGISQNMIDDINTEDSDINIHSMLPSELPQVQHQRKRARLQHSEQDSQSHHSSQIFPYDSALVKAINMKPDDRQITSNLGFKQQRPEDVIILPLETGVQIPMKQAKISKKSIQVYRNENHRSYEANEGSVFKKKKFLSSEPLIGQAYDIIQQSDSISVNPQRAVVPGVKEAGKFRLNWSHAPSQKLAINTKNQHHKKKDDDSVSETQLDQYSIRSKPNKLPDTRMVDTRIDDTRLIPFTSHSKGDHYDCKCECCGGFYCQNCHSTIPPKYRPVPSKEKQEELDNQQIRQFWNAYYERLKNRPVCKACQPDEVMNSRV